ncbi:hypothetical protein V8E36_006962 [Tilletia maclaganii]
MGAEFEHLNRRNNASDERNLTNIDSFLNSHRFDRHGPLHISILASSGLFAIFVFSFPSSVSAPRARAQDSLLPALDAKDASVSNRHFLLVDTARCCAVACQHRIRHMPALLQPWGQGRFLLTHSVMVTCNFFQSRVRIRASMSTTLTLTSHRVCSAAFRPSTGVSFVYSLRRIIPAFSPRNNPVRPLRFSFKMTGSFLSLSVPPIPSPPTPTPLPTTAPPAVKVQTPTYTPSPTPFNPPQSKAAQRHSF